MGTFDAYSLTTANWQWTHIVRGTSVPQDRNYFEYTKLSSVKVSWTSIHLAENEVYGPIAAALNIYHFVCILHPGNQFCAPKSSVCVYIQNLYGQ